MTAPTLAIRISLWLAKPASAYCLTIRPSIAALNGCGSDWM